MILVVNTCSDKLSELEFVKPIETVLQKTKIKFRILHYTKIPEEELIQVKKAIISSTALKDINYLLHTKEFSWLKNFKKPLLGIGGGSLILTRAFEGRLREKVLIGRLRVRVIKNSILAPINSFQAYFLSSHTVEELHQFDILANTIGIDCMFKHKIWEIYGCLFCPEVLNTDIITRFCES